MDLTSLDCLKHPVLLVLLLSEKKVFFLNKHAFEYTYFHQVSPVVVNNKTGML